MKIESSSISLGSQHARSREVAVDESLRAWVGAQRPDFEGRAANGRAAAQGPPGTVATISDAARQAARNAPADGGAVASATAASAADGASDDASMDSKLQLLISLIESLTGQKMNLLKSGELQLGQAMPTPPAQANAAAQGAQAPQRQGWGLEYDRHETVRESEQTSFRAQGIIRTSDGMDIAFKITLDMKREFFQESSLSVRAGDAVLKDPLVINFKGSAAQLGIGSFSFDLDGDGQTESVPMFNADSGLLALDKNGNGVIDNGLELFGTQSGNGFADLAAYDSDKNNWIDENDAIYSRLRIWTKDATGNDQLSTLAQRNVGALYLGNVTTPFDLKNSENTLLGQVRASGIYLREDGSTGTLQQVDLVV